MAHRLPALTERQKAHVRKVGRELLDAYESGETDDLSEDTVYGVVEAYPDGHEYVYLVRHGVSTRVALHPGRRAVGAKRKAGRKTATRKKVPSKKVANPRKRNPSRRSPAMDAFTRAYIDAALWSSTDDDGNPLDRDYSTRDFSGATLMQMKRDAARFQREHGDDLAAGSSAQGGRDFWLTRNGHGAGFWDGDWPEPEASRLTAAAKRFGEVDLYVSDAGKIRSYTEKKRVGAKRAAGRKTAKRKVANPRRKAPKRRAKR